MTDLQVRVPARIVAPRLHTQVCRRDSASMPPGYFGTRPLLPRDDDAGAAAAYRLHVTADLPPGFPQRSFLSSRFALPRWSCASSSSGRTSRAGTKARAERWIRSRSERPCSPTATPAARSPSRNTATVRRFSASAATSPSAAWRASAPLQAAPALDGREGRPAVARRIGNYVAGALTTAGVCSVAGSAPSTSSQILRRWVSSRYFIPITNVISATAIG